MPSRRRLAAARAAAAEVAAEASPGPLEQLIAAAVGRRAGLGELTPWELPVTVACRDLLANTIGQLPLVNHRGNLPTATQPSICLQPDPFEPRWLSLHRLVNNLTRHGYVWLIPTAWQADDWPAAVRVVDADRAAATFDPSGRLASVWYEDRELSPGVDGAIWLPWRVERAGDLGSSPLAACWTAVEYLGALWEMAGSFWEAGFPSLALVVQQALSVTQRRETKTAMLEAWRRRHEPAVIDRGGQLVPVGSNAVDSQLVESIETANTEVARAFAVVPSLVNVRAGDSLTYSTTTAEFSRWLKLGLGQYLSRIDDAFSQCRPFGQTVRLSTAELLRTDLEARYAAYDQALGRWLTVAEVRAAEGLEPLSAADLAAMPAPRVPPALLPSALTDPVGV